MDVANLNPMVAPIQAVEAVQPVQSGGGGTFIYVIVVIVLLVSLIAAGYLFYTSQSPRVVDQFPPGYVGPKPDPTPTPTPDTAPMDISEDDSIVTVEPPDTEPITVKQVDNVTEDVSSVEREMTDLGTDVEQEPQTETPPVQTTLNDIPASPSVEQKPQTETPTLNDIIENITLASPSVEQEPQTETPSVQDTLNDISAKITFVSPSPSVEQATPTLDNVQTQVQLVTPVVSTTPTSTLGNIRKRVKLDSVQTQFELVTPLVSTTSTLGNIRERVKLKKKKPVFGDSCEFEGTKDPNGSYLIGTSGTCELSQCSEGYIKSGNKCTKLLRKSGSEHIKRGTSPEKAAFKTDYYYEPGTYYEGDEVFNENTLFTDFPNSTHSDEARERQCFTKCDKDPNCDLVTFAKGTPRNLGNWNVECWGRGKAATRVERTSDGRFTRGDNLMDSDYHNTYHKKSSTNIT